MRSMLLDMEEHSQFPKSCKKCKDMEFYIRIVVFIKKREISPI
jgi:predicted nucleic-acid-binding Zn-ribbon protein